MTSCPWPSLTCAGNGMRASWLCSWANAAGESNRTAPVRKRNKTERERTSVLKEHLLDVGSVGRGAAKPARFRVSGDESGSPAGADAASPVIIQRDTRHR